jgi:tetraacyldisaccharide 4'-kinase
MGLFEIIYYVGYRINTARVLRKLRRLPARVISVGNITTGGTGKTPAVIALAEEAARRGLRPCVLTRGYGGKWKNTCMVSPGMSAADVGDEPLLMARRLDGMPVVKDPDRYRGAMYALENVEPPPDVFLLDDGFQHRALHRDVDILLISARDPLYKGRLLPMGLLREPVKEIRRADFIVVTKISGVEEAELYGIIAKYNKDAPVFVADHVPSVIVRAASEERMGIEQLLGRDVFAFCGIAEPGHFIDLLRKEGAVVRGMKEYRDHFAFRRKDLEVMRQEAGKCGAEWIITTEKDIMRIKGGGYPLPDNLFSLGIEFAIKSDIEKEFYGLVFDKVSAREA